MLNEYLNLIRQYDNYYLTVILAVITLYIYIMTEVDINTILNSIKISIPVTVIEKIKCIGTIIFTNTVRLLSTIVSVCGIMSIYAVYAEIPKHNFFVYCLFNFIPTFALYIQNILNGSEIIIKIKLENEGDSK